MRWVLVAPLLLVLGGWLAQGGGGGGASYTGSGDAVSGASGYWSCSFAYSAATRGNKACNVCNVSDIVCADVSSDATTGIVSSTQVIGGVTCGTTVGVNLCTVKTLYDQTATVGDATQATIGNRGTFKPNDIGSIPGVSNAAGGSTVVYTSSGNFNQAAYTFAVATATHTGSGANDRCMDSANVPLLGENSSTQPIMYAGAFATSSTTMSNDTFYALIGTDDSGSGNLTVSVNGGTRNTGTGGTTATSGTIALMNITGGGGPNCNGEFLEFRVDPVVVSSGNDATLGANMKSRGGY